jgi:polar amino acid transport system substrate-binding protein
VRVPTAAVLVALALALPAGAAAPPTKEPGELVVGVSMPVAGLQVGAVRGRDVVLAKGLEIELARAIAKEVGVPRVRFVNEAFFSTLVSGRLADWDLAIAAITITPERSRRVDFSSSYLVVDQAVLMRQGWRLPVPASIAGLRNLQLCSERATTGARTIVETIKPRKKPRLANDPSQLLYDLYNDRCDAVVYDADILGVERATAPERYGPFAGRIVTRERYGIAFPKGSPLRASVNAALRTLTRNGTLARLQKRWLSTDISKLPVLR